MEKVRIGIVGLNRGTVHLRKAKYCPNLEVVAVCDLDREKAAARARQFAIPAVYDTYEELLQAPDIDAVILATPIDDHAEHVLMALAAGKHVLSEVIVATTIADCRRIAAALKQSDRKYMMAENYCFIRPVTIIRNLVKAGLFGDIYYAEGDYLKDFQEYNPNFPNIGGWRQATYFGRQGHPYITHSLGPLADIMGEQVEKVVCMAAGHSFDMKADNTCTLLCQTRKGNMIRLRNSFVSPRPDNVTYYSFQGTKGCYQGPQGPTDFHKVHLAGLCRPDEWKNVYEFSDYLPAAWDLCAGDRFDNHLDNDTYNLYDNGTALMLAAFADCIINNTEPPVNFDQAVNWTMTGILSEDSVTNNSQPVPVPDFCVDKAGHQSFNEEHTIR